MQFGFVGINYKNAPLNIWDKIALTDDKKLMFFQKAEQAGVVQCMALSTCNRSEVYFVCETKEQREKIRHIYEDMFPDVSAKDYLVEL